MEQKKRIRNLISSKIKKLSSFKKNKETKQIIKKLSSHPKVSQSSCLLIYSALSDEVDLSLFFDFCLDRKKTICFPRIHNHTLTIHKIDHFSSLSKQRHSMLEPSDLNPLINPKSLDCVLVPGRAFAFDGTRLGRGFGYYDRFLTRCPQSYKIGIAFSCQMMDHLPKENHDICMDEIILCH